MAFYFLNRVDKSVSKKDLEIEFRKFGKLKFIGDIQQDKKDSRFNSTVAVFHEVTNLDALNKYCENKKIFLREKVDNNGSIKETSHFKKPLLKVQTIFNPSFYFYKDEAYGKGIEEFNLKENFHELFQIQGTQSFELTTLYPGLLVGSGYNHPKLKENSDDFQLGFFFDHTTGLPLISGSSIKGIIKSVCAQTEFMKDIYNATIDLDIFEDQSTVFYDAYISDTKNSHNKIFGSDHITSHYSDEPNGEFKNPQPIKFLKILPDVTFKFQFQCEEKYLQVFKDIIKDFGLGARTNVGYGKFIE